MRRNTRRKSTKEVKRDDNNKNENGMRIKDRREE
jgi:hypothetical protein